VLKDTELISHVLLIWQFLIKLCHSLDL